MQDLPESSEEDRPGEKANAIEKALKLLLEFLPNNHPMTTVELSKATGFHNATTSRILLTLAEHGFLRQDPVSKRFTVGRSVVQLAAAVDRSLRSGIASIVKPHLDRLSEATGQTVTLELASSDGSVLACVVEGPKRVRVAGQVGETLPWNVSCGLRSMMAFMPHDERERYFARPMKTFTANTVDTPEQFRELLSEVRRNGYAYEDGEFFAGVNALGAPLFGHDGKPIASVCLIGLANEVNDANKRLVEALKAATGEISKQFFHENGD